MVEIEARSESHGDRVRLPVPVSRQRSGRTRQGELQRQANRRRQTANRMMVLSVIALMGLVAFFYKVLSF